MKTYITDENKKNGPQSGVEAQEGGKKRKAGRQITVCLFWLVLWQAAALAAGIPLLLPGPADTARTLFELAGEKEFYLNIGWTMFRCLLSMALSFAAGTAAAWGAYRSGVVRSLLTLPVGFFKAVPVMAIIIYVILVASADWVAVIVCFLMCFPVVYTNVLAGLDGMSRELLELARIYRLTAFQKIRYIYRPGITSQVNSAVMLIAGLSWKAVVAAEVLSIPKYSLGYEMINAKYYLETPTLFAYIFVIVVLSIAIERLIGLLLKNRKAESYEGSRLFKGGVSASEHVSAVNHNFAGSYTSGGNHVSDDTHTPTAEHVRAGKHISANSNTHTSTDTYTPAPEHVSTDNHAPDSNNSSGDNHAPENSRACENSHVSGRREDSADRGEWENCQKHDNSRNSLNETNVKLEANVKTQANIETGANIKTEADIKTEASGRTEPKSKEPPRLILSDISKSYGDKKVLEHIDIIFERGETTVITGPSGRGKTTLARIISGLEKADGGVAETDRPADIAYLFQEDRLLPWLNVYDNMAFGLLRNMGDNESPNDDMIKQMAEDLEINDVLWELPHKLSGGMKHRVALGRTFLAGSNLLILDEPLRGLDVKLKRRIMEKLWERNTENKTVIVMTHEPDIFTGKNISL